MQSVYQAEVLRYGEYVHQLITKIMAEDAYRNLKKVQAIFRLAEISSVLKFVHVGFAIAVLKSGVRVFL